MLNCGFSSAPWRHIRAFQSPQLCDIKQVQPLSRISDWSLYQCFLMIICVLSLSMRKVCSFSCFSCFRFLDISPLSLQYYWLGVLWCYYSVITVSYHGMKVAAHLQQTLQSFHHLLLAELVEPGLIGGFTVFQLLNGGLQSHRSTLEDTHTWRHTKHIWIFWS